MNFKSQFYASVVLGSLMMIFSGLFVVYVLLVNVINSWYMLISSFVFLIGLSVVWGQVRLKNKFAAKTFEKYKRDNPKCFSGRKVSCNNCGGSRIIVRGLLNHTYHREHFCSQCGKVLYYTPE